MSEASANSAPADHGHDHPSYVKIWAILLALLIVSVLGPMLGHKVVTLITAFGIAIVKAYLVARYFMHLPVEPKYIAYLLGGCLTFMFLMFAGISPDVMKHSGNNWENLAAQAEVNRVLHASSASTAPVAPVAPDVAFRTTCSPCHGTSGEGNGPAAASLTPHPANFTSPDFWATRDRAHVARVIRGGGASVGRSPLMPSFGAQFDEARAEALAAYVEETFRPESAADPHAADGAAEGLAGDAGTP